MAWEGSDRLQRLPSDWEARRKRVLRRDGHACQSPRCSARATHVDHIEPSGSDEEWNLQALCAYHHNKKSSREGNAAQARLRKLLKREPEQSPGAISPRDAVPRARKGW